MRISIIIAIIIASVLSATQPTPLSKEEQFVAGFLSIDKSRRRLSKTEENTYLKELLRVTNISIDKAVLILDRYSLDTKGWGRFIDQLNEKTAPVNKKAKKITNDTKLIDSSKKVTNTIKKSIIKK